MKRDTSNTKTCARCREDKPATGEYFRRREANGPFQSWCRACQRAYDRERRAAAASAPVGRPRKYSSDPHVLIREIVGRLRALEIALNESPKSGATAAGRTEGRKSDSRGFCQPFAGPPERIGGAS